MGRLNREMREGIAQEHMQAEEQRQMQLALQMQHHQQQAAVTQQIWAEIRQMGMKLYVERMLKLISEGNFDELTEARTREIALHVNRVSHMLHDSFGNIKARPWDEIGLPPPKEPEPAKDSKIIAG